MPIGFILPTQQQLLMKPILFGQYNISLPTSPQPRKCSIQLSKRKQSLKPLKSLQKQSKINPYFPVTTEAKRKSLNHTTKKPVQFRSLLSTQKCRQKETVLMPINPKHDLPETRKVRVHTLDCPENPPQPSLQSRIRNGRNLKNNKNARQRTIANLSTTLYLKQEQEAELTQFEQNEAKIYDVYFVGQRRIHEEKDFSDQKGDPIVQVGDSIMFRYQIISELGRGAFGMVFKAFDHKRQEAVALKIIKNHPKYQKQARIQIRILQTAIQNDSKQRYNIVKLKHAFLFRGHPCLSFQLLHQTLFQTIVNFHSHPPHSSSLSSSSPPSSPPFPLSLLRRIAIQLIHSLYFLHKHNIIHCDLKPENIMLRKENKTGIKIIDLGSGCFEGEQLYNYIQSRYYRAPEIVFGVPYSKQIDIWSFGCVLAEIFLGVPVFPGKNQADQVGLFVEVIGLPPRKLTQRGSRSNIYIDNNQQLKTIPGIKPRVPNSRSLQKILKKCPDPNFIDFISKILVWNPEQRMSASEALYHPWITSGLPQQLQAQHFESLQG